MRFHVQPAFRCRCSPQKLASLHKTLNDQQRKAVMNSGFGSLLKLESQNLPREFIMKLVTHFNPTTSRIEFGRFKSYDVTPLAVARALGLDSGTKPVPKDPHDEHVGKMRRLFADNNAERISTSKIEAFIRKQTQEGLAGEEFIRAYLLFAFASFLCPTTKDEAGPNLYPPILDFEVDHCREYAWSEFIHDWLVKSLSTYKTRVQSETKKKEIAGIGGCLHLLMVKLAF